VIPAKTSCDEPVSLMDIYPTLVELSGFKKPSHLDGHSLVPQIKNPNTATAPVVSSYQFSWTEKPFEGHAVRSKNYRYIYYPDIGLEELYDHQTDPNEWDNIAYKKENQSIVENHRKVLLEMLPNLKWKSKTPEGYHIDPEGNVSFLNYTEFAIQN
jgi:arylsulfatase A-like enzyme